MHAHDGDEYRHVLELRSDVQLLVDLYANTPAAERLRQIDMSDADEQLELRAPDYWSESIPDWVPANHVWWQRHADEH